MVATSRVEAVRGRHAATGGVHSQRGQVSARAYAGPDEPICSWRFKPTAGELPEPLVPPHAGFPGEKTGNGSAPPVLRCGPGKIRGPVGRADYRRVALAIE